MVKGLYLKQFQQRFNLATLLLIQFILSTSGAGSLQTACDAALFNSVGGKAIGITKSLLLSAEYAVTEGTRVRQQLQSLSHKRRVEAPIAYFREQIPLVMQFLDGIDSEKLESPYESVTGVIESTSVNDAINALKQSGELRYSSHQATYGWYLKFVYEILFLSNYINKIGSVNYVPDLARVRAINKLTEMNQASAAGVIWWPTFAQLTTRHFENWDLGLGLLGLTFEDQPEYDNTFGSPFDFYEHDVNHALRLFYILSNDEVRNSYLKFRKIIRKQLSAHSGETKSLLNLMLYDEIHEGNLLSRFTELVDIANTAQNKSAPLDLALNSNDFINSVLIGMHDHELSPQFLSLSESDKRLQLENISVIFSQIIGNAISATLLPL